MRPCVAGPPGSCAVALLCGAPCCPDGSCALCARSERVSAAHGHGAAVRSAAWLRMRPEDAPAACPVCGCPPPPPIAVLPDLERLPRDGPQATLAACSRCGSPLPPGRRRLCRGCETDRPRLPGGGRRNLPRPEPEPPRGRVFRRARAEP